MKFKNYLIDSLKGFVIGMAIILPGISGGAVAALLGVYDKMIGAVADIGKHFKASIKVLLPIFIGLIFSVSLFFPLDILLKIAPFPVIALFVGMMMGGVPELTKKLKGKINVRNILLVIAGFIFSASIGVVSVFALEPAVLTNIAFPGLLLLFVVGFCASTTLATPGISGSITLLALGYYVPLVAIATELLSFQTATMLNNFLVALAFGIGMLVGFFLISKFMKFLLGKFLIPTSFAIVGIVLGSFVSSFFNNETVALATETPEFLSTWQIIGTVLALVVGFATTLILEKIVEKKKALKAKEN
jgi:putative membrane protein